MPNQRAAGQKLLPIAVDERFLRELDAGLVRTGYWNRSQFIRDAIVEKLVRVGFAMPRELALPPRRIGKGAGASGKVRYPAHRPSGYALNERPPSTKAKQPKKGSASRRNPAAK